MAGTPIESLHPNKTTQSHINYLITASVMCFASTLLVLLRFIQRYKLVARRTFWWDDWVILAALICAYGNFASGILTKWTGYHSGQYSVEELNTFAKVSYPRIWVLKLRVANLILPLEGHTRGRDSLQCKHHFIQSICSVLLQPHILSR